MKWVCDQEMTRQGAPRTKVSGGQTNPLNSCAVGCILARSCEMPHGNQRSHTRVLIEARDASTIGTTI